MSNMIDMIRHTLITPTYTAVTRCSCTEPHTQFMFILSTLFIIFRPQQAGDSVEGCKKKRSSSSLSQTVTHILSAVFFTLTGLVLWSHWGGTSKHLIIKTLLSFTSNEVVREVKEGKTFVNNMLDLFTTQHHAPPPLTDGIFLLFLLNFNESRWIWSPLNGFMDILFLTFCPPVFLNISSLLFELGGPQPWVAALGEK